MHKKALKTCMHITIGAALAIVVFYFVSGLFLSCNKPIESRYVLLEDWVSYSVMEDVADYFVENDIDSIFIVGMKNPETSASLSELNKTRKLKKRKKTYSMYWSGILGFNISSERLNSPSSISVKMRGTKGGGFLPHYNIYANKTLIGSGFVNEKDSIYKFNLSKKTDSSLSHILVIFDNDRSTPKGDRNLYVSEIYIDSLDIDSLLIDDFFIQKTAEFNLNFISNLRSVKYYLNDLGYDSTKVRLVETDYYPLNKTLAMAKGAKKYFGKAEIKNLNIITSNEHSSRSYLNFKNCLNENIEVGCIPSNSDIHKKKSLYAGFDERVSLILTYIYWWFN